MARQSFADWLGDVRAAARELRLLNAEWREYAAQREKVREATPPQAEAQPVMEIGDAMRIVQLWAGRAGVDVHFGTLRLDKKERTRAVRAALRASHPNSPGGDPNGFRDVIEARDLFERELG